MKQANSILSTYAADVSGAASALYELGGMTVIHDASGCNSTYNTHDEPRWYDKPSMVFISALTELDALMGDDSKLIDDIIRAAEELSPRFISIVGTPIPALMGLDFNGIAHIIEEKTGIPAFGIASNGMNSYNVGADAAFSAVAKKFLKPYDGERNKSSVNLLGVTPLDFSVTGNAAAMKKYFEEHGLKVNSCWGMDSAWEELMNSGKAGVNVLASSCGEKLAEIMSDIYGTPVVEGLPIGREAGEEFIAFVRRASETGTDTTPYHEACDCSECRMAARYFVIGEHVQAHAIAHALADEFDLYGARVISQLDIPDEDAIFSELKNAELVIADPLFKPALPESCKFVPLPHEGYSGRIFRKNIPIFIGSGFNEWIEKEIKDFIQQRR